MFLDASAVVAILNREPGFEDYLTLAGNSPTPLVYSPLSRFESIVGLARIRSGPGRLATPAQIDAIGALVDDLLSQLQARNIDLTDQVGTAALEAAKSYGRAVGHPAALNLGDCFAYACARAAGVGLIYKGEDFARTDLAR